MACLVDDRIGIQTYPSRYSMPSLQRVRHGRTHWDNARSLLTSLSADGPPAAINETVAWNAALILYAAGRVSSLLDGLPIARDAIATGAAFAKLQDCIEYSKSAMN